jgi:hypothetical protein
VCHMACSSLHLSHKRASGDERETALGEAAPLMLNLDIHSCTCNQDECCRSPTGSPRANPTIWPPKGGQALFSCLRILNSDFRKAKGEARALERKGDILHVVLFMIL